MFRKLLLALVITGNLIFAQDVVINEVMASNQTAILDEDDDASDYLELYNKGTEPINLTGYYLSDNIEKIQKWQFGNAVVEPGVEMAIDCFICKGKGCRVCSGEGWIEILGAGMVHPDVLRRVGYDPDIYTGFAFGMGLERIPMLKYGIDDIRHFYANSLRFLEQF